MSKDEFTVGGESLADLDKVRETLYMLSLEENLDRNVRQIVSAASYSLYHWLQRFAQPRPLDTMADYIDDKDTHHEWDVKCADDLWEAQK
jgi:hypothetical protein